MARSLALKAIEEVRYLVGDSLRPRALGRTRAPLRRRHIGIDNSAAERALRAVAIGRKNYLLAGSDSGGERAGAI